MSASTVADVEREAAAAAADAAREARADVLERSGPIDTGPPRSARQQKRLDKLSADADGYKRFVVDVWITNLNHVEFGVYKRSRNRARSRQFTADMDVFAEIIENGKRTGLLAYREDLWAKKTGLDKRLVFKLFTEGLGWRATMDLMLGRSLQQTLGARGLPVMTYSINTNDDDNIIYVERSANKWVGLPENFSFFLLVDGKPYFYRLKRDLIDLGGDYTLYDQQDKEIGHIDGRVFSIGGYWTGQVRADHADKRMMATLKLFCGMLIFNKQCRQHLKRLHREMLRGTLDLKLEKQEADLYMNPRRVR